MLLKKAKESWKNSFDEVLASSEKKEFANARRYYESEYNKAIAEFLKTRKGTGFDDLFRVADLSDIYRQIYVNIGLFLKLQTFLAMRISGRIDLIE